MSSSVISCHALFLSVGSRDWCHVFVADDARCDECELVVAVNLVVRVALLTSFCHDEPESECLTMNKYICESRNVLSGAVDHADDGSSDESAGSGSGDGDRGDDGLMFLVITTIQKVDISSGARILPNQIRGLHYEDNSNSTSLMKSHISQGYKSEKAEMTNQINFRIVIIF